MRQEQVVALPLRERKFLDLAMLSEGVVRPPGGTRGDAMQQAGTLVNVLGQRSGHNLYLLDGVTVTDQYFNNMVISPSVDAVQEFNIEKTSYTPEFGGKSGAVINVITKSGSNAFHGSLFEFVRNDMFDAKNSSIRRRRRFRRSARTSSAAASADRSSGTGRFSRPATKASACASR